MKLVSPLLKKVLYPGLATAGYFRRRPLQGNLCVVTYHGVLPEDYQPTDPALDGNLVSIQTLRAQLQLLKSNYHVLTGREALQWLEFGATLPPRSVLLTCDDGLQNVLSDMVPVLLDEGVSCLFFVTGVSTGDLRCMLWYEELYLLLMAAQTAELSFPDLKLQAQITDRSQRRVLWWSWVKELSQHSPEIRQRFLEAFRVQAGLSSDWTSAYQTGPAQRRFFLMTSDELRQLALMGMPIGAHTMSHPVLAHASRDAVWTEMSQSREALQALLGKAIWAMAYPFGDPGSAGVREFEMAERAGYKCAFLNFGGGFCANPNSSRFAIPRLHVTADMTLGEFEAHVSGFHQTLKQRLGSWGSAPCA